MIHTNDPRQVEEKHFKTHDDIKLFYRYWPTYEGFCRSGGIS